MSSHRNFFLPTLVLYVSLKQIFLFRGSVFLVFFQAMLWSTPLSFSSYQHYYYQPRMLVQKRVFSHFQSDISPGAFWLCFRELDSLCAFPPSSPTLLYMYERSLSTMELLSHLIAVLTSKEHQFEGDNGESHIVRWSRSRSSSKTNHQLS